MAATRKKVVIAMSGGVDSSVAACLLVEQGYDVVGLFMRTGVKGTEADTPTNPQGSACANPPDSSDPATIRASDTAASPDPLPLHAGNGCPDPRSSGAGRTAPTNREHKGCCSASDAADARFVAGMLGIPFYSLNFERDFDSLIDYFADEYARGRTPNPCVVCNDKLKFGRLVEYADAVGARYIATGHYARIAPRHGMRHARSLTSEDSKDPHLLRAVDRRKDQSYVLFGVERELLDRLVFPIGALTKPQVREIAARYNLPNQGKPDSVEICFVPDRDYARVVRDRRPDVFTGGRVVDAAGQVLGTHQGIAHYTIGQRRGLGIAAGRPIYVTNLDVETNTVTVGEDRDLLQAELSADRVNYLIDPPAGPFRAGVKIRYLHTAAPATIHPTAENAVRVEFDEPQRAVTPGQAAVFYDGDTVLGGGWIT